MLLLFGFGCAPFPAATWLCVTLTSLPPRVKAVALRSISRQEAHRSVVGIPYGFYPLACLIRRVHAWLEAVVSTKGLPDREPSLVPHTSRWKAVPV